ncbi:MAG: YaaC family protein [Cyanobacteriota bacterium]
MRLTSKFLTENERNLGYFPDTVEDINGRKFYILKPEEYLPEPASHFIILFCLGMLCRYYPDVWMKVIDISKK